CSIALATASMMTECVAGKSRQEIDALAGRFARMVRGEAQADAGTAGDAELGDLRALSGVSRVPARIPCALLPWEALARALSDGAMGAGLEP
ncbi:MAG TPA: hypothetical protein VFW98_07540, partial [Gemmatimonadaceae bacterium]|nr:hypothetical protein [Gemmatimonadaceae bacterium]